MAKYKIFAMWLVVVLLIAPVQSQQSPDDIDALLADMTTEQKVAQMVMVSFYGEALNQPARDLIQRWQPGAVVLLPSNLKTPSQITHLTNNIQQTLTDSGGIPAFIAADQEGGIIARLEDGFTRFPVPMVVTATQNSELTQAYGAAIASEMRAVGLNMNLAPVADLHTNRDNPIIGRRAFGTYAEYVAPTVADIVRGMQSTGVLATAKHFPGHGDTREDSHLTIPVLPFNQQELLDRELIPFQATINADVGAVMMSHIYLPAIEPEQQLPASLSHNVITALLRESLAYDGIVMTDALDMDAIDTVYSPAQATLRAIQAGNDLVLIGAHVSPDAQAQAMQTVVDAVNDGTLNMEQIDASVHRILRAKERFGVLNWQPNDASTASSRINQAAHAQLIDSVFEAGITLAHGTMPPDSNNTAFIFPANWQSLWRECQADGWRAVGYSTTPTNDEIQWAEQVAAQAGRVIVITENADSNRQQQRLVNNLPMGKTIVVALWSPYDINVLPTPAAYLLTYSPSPAAYRPLCAILKGKAQPIGTLPIALD